MFEIITYTHKRKNRGKSLECTRESKNGREQGQTIKKDINTELITYLAYKQTKLRLLKSTELIAI